MRLPRLVAGREFASPMVEGMLGDVAGEDVVVDCGELLSGSASFAAGLVEAILVDGKASSMTLQDAPDKFAAYVTAAVRELSVADRFDLSGMQHAG
jgi:hypothetical protein